MVRTAFFHLVLVAVAALFAYLLIDGAADWQALPDAPRLLTVAELDGAGDAPWVQLSDGVPMCDGWVRKGEQDFVPIVARQGEAFVVAKLGRDDLCATLPENPVGVLKELDVNGGEARETMSGQLARLGSNAPGARRAMFVPLADPPGEARNNVIAFGALLAAFSAIEALLIGRWLRERARARALRGGVTGGSAPAAAPGIATRVEAVIEHARADEAVLPAGPLLLSDAALRRVTLARFVGLPLLLGGAVVAGFFAVRSAWWIVDDVRTWERAAPVDAEVKGEVRRYQGVFVSTDVQAAYLDPHSGQLAKGAVSFSTWIFEPDRSATAVRAVPGEPGHIVLEASVRSWRARVPTPLVLCGIAALLVVAARGVRKNLGKLAAIAADPVEAHFVVGGITELRTNGATTGYTVRGALDGVERSFTLGARTPPDRLVAADGTGAVVLVVQARGRPEWFEPLLVDLWPFALGADQRARAQAVLQARGSATRLAL